MRVSYTSSTATVTTLVTCPVVLHEPGGAVWLLHPILPRAIHSRHIKKKKNLRLLHLLLPRSPTLNVRVCAHSDLDACVVLPNWTQIASAADFLLRGLRLLLLWWSRWQSLWATQWHFLSSLSSLRSRANVERLKICLLGHPSGTTSNTQACTRTCNAGQRHGGSCQKRKYCQSADV